MNKNLHYFDPAQALKYPPKLTDSAIDHTINTTELQHLFYQLNQPESDYNIMPKAYDFIQQQLQHAKQYYATEIIQDYNVDKPCSLQVAKITPLAKQFWTEDNLNTWVKQTTVVLLTQPHWLRNISPAVASQTSISVKLMSMYLQLTRKDPHGIKLEQAYQAMLLTTGTKIPSLHSHNFIQQSEPQSELLVFAAIQLTLSHFPRVLLAEILGYSLAYCQMPTPIEICFPEHQLPGIYFQQHKSRLRQQISPLLECITTYLDYFPQQAQSLWLRIQNGFWLYQLKMHNCSEQFNATLSASVPVQQAVATLLQRKAVAAIGHHQTIQLQEKSLEEWFAGLPENTHDFLQALMHSGYVDKLKPENSPLLKLFAFKGPMFGVLNQSEQDTLLNWLKTGVNVNASYVDEVPALPIAFPRHKTNSPPLFKRKTKNAMLSNRELYYYLLNVDLFAEVLPIAKSKLRKLLSSCAFFNPLPFKHYSHQQFDVYIKNIYQREVDTYKPLRGQPKISKQAYIWGFEQIAPLILIDGCWIQNSLALQNIYPEISEILFDIFCDEIGNGQLEQNHPFIFQQLLDSLSIQLPPAYSKEFIEHTGFIKSAFDLPVYMLSISSFSVEFLPELLGLNMAIELSGLGKSYMRLVDDWNYWGIDPSIASIHISIDNYASGHTFLAKKAIQIYMDGIMQSTGNQKIINSHWKRIYCGYASLRFIGGRFKFSLPIAYLINTFRKKHSLGKIA